MSSAQYFWLSTINFCCFQLVQAILVFCYYFLADFQLILQFLCRFLPFHFSASFFQLKIPSIIQCFSSFTKRLYSAKIHLFFRFMIFLIFFFFSELKGRKWRLARKNCRRSGRRPKERPGGVRSIQLMSSPFRYNNNIMLFSSFLAGIFKKSRKSVFLLKKTLPNSSCLEIRFLKQNIACAQ